MSANVCPCCGQGVAAAGVLVSLERNSLSYRGQTIHMPPNEAEIAFILAERAPLPVSRAIIVERVWGMAEREPTAKNIDVHIHHLRDRLRGIGLGVVTYRERGYALEPSTDAMFSRVLHTPERLRA